MQPWRGHSSVVIGTDVARNGVASESYIFISSSSSSSLPNISENTNTNTTQAWTFGANMPHPRTEIAGALLQTGNDKKIYTIGGYDISGKTTALNDAYTIGNDSWNNEPPLPVAVNHAAAASFNGLIYVIGGYLQDNNQQPSDRLFIFNPATGEWREGARMPARKRCSNSKFCQRILICDWRSR